MARLKIRCSDLFILTMATWGIMDLCINWTNYKNCKGPLGYWILISMIIILFVRIYQLTAFAIAYEEFTESNRVNINQTYPEVKIQILRWNII